MEDIIITTWIKLLVIIFLVIQNIRVGKDYYLMVNVIPRVEGKCSGNKAKYQNDE